MRREPTCVRIIEPGGVHHRRLGFVIDEGDDWFEVWIGDHDETFRYRLPRDHTVAISGSWIPVAGKGQWFVVKEAEN